MSDDFANVYDDETRARSYAALEFPGTYALAFRDLPRLIREHVAQREGGGRAFDFGCGTGRSSRFLRDLGFDVVGADRSAAMLAQARERDPAGDYRLVEGERLEGIPRASFHLVLSAFTFDNVPTGEQKTALLAAIGRLLAPGGRIINLVSSPEIYTHEWASFTTRDFPENRTARSGDRVRIVMLDVGDARPVEDVLWSEEAYAAVYRQAGLIPIAVHRPLATGTEPVAWVSETTVSPWVITVLAAASDVPNAER